MLHLASYEVFFYGGILTMAVAAVFLIIFLVVYQVRGKKLKKKLDEEYGDPQHYNRKNGR